MDLQGSVQNNDGLFRPSSETCVCGRWKGGMQENFELLGFYGDFIRLGARVYNEGQNRMRERSSGCPVGSCLDCRNRFCSWI